MQRLNGKKSAYRNFSIYRMLVRQKQARQYKQESPDKRQDSDQGLEKQTNTILDTLEE
jgi:hypothetical protein